MKDWTVQIDGRAKALTEVGVRRKLRSGDLSGVELCRMPGASEWSPLHDTPLFKEEVPHVGDPAAAARGRVLRGLGWHLAGFLGVMAFLGFPWWGIFWGLAVVGHAMSAAPAIRSLLGGGTAQPAPTEAAPSPVQEDPFEQRLSALLSALSDSDGDLTGIAGSARRIHAQIIQIDEALSGVSLAELEAQGDEGTDGERLARAGHIAAIESAMASRERLAGQERELLHSLERLRLARLQQAPTEDLTEQLGELQHRMDAEAEVERKLSAARSAQRQRT